MQIDGVATLVMTNMLRDSIKRSQQDLAEAQLEFSTGRHADVGLTLGAGTGRDLTWRAQLAELQSLSDGNKLAGTRLDLTQSALSQMRDVASSFMATLTAVRGAQDGQTTARAAAQSALSSLTGLLNTSYGGQFLFAGIASDKQPVADYPGSPAGAAKTAVDAAFLGAFGFDQSSASVTGIGAAAMQNFLDNDFAALFAPAAWSATWSQASDTVTATRIDTGQRIDSGVSANADPFRSLAQAFTMMIDMGSGQLNQTAFETVIDAALKLTGESVLGIGNVQSQLGIAQNRISSATEHIGLRIDTITAGIGAIEGVDSYEAANRANTLQTQLEASYALTGRIARLTILNYI